MANVRLPVLITTTLVAGVALGGCFDGTVRSPTEASGNRHAGNPQRQQANRKPGGKRHPMAAVQRLGRR